MRRSYFGYKGHFAAEKFDPYGTLYADHADLKWVLHSSIENAFVPENDPYKNQVISNGGLSKRNAVYFFTCRKS